MRWQRFRLVKNLLTIIFKSPFCDNSSKAIIKIKSNKQINDDILVNFCRLNSNGCAWHNPSPLKNDYRQVLCLWYIIRVDVHQKKGVPCVTSIPKCNRSWKISVHDKLCEERSVRRICLRRQESNIYPVSWQFRITKHHIDPRSRRRSLPKL